MGKNGMKWFLGLAALGVLASGCQQNPFPETGMIQEKEPEKPVYTPVYVLDTPGSAETEEGKSFEFKMKASVPAPGKAIVAAHDLPQGAVFDADTLTLKWTPSFDAANQDSDLNVTTRTYPIKFSLYSSEDPLSFITRTLTVVVRDVPRNVSIKPLASIPEFTETKTGSFEIEIVDEDFPKGPFDLSSNDMPQGVRIEANKASPNKFTISWTPDLSEVTRNGAMIVGGNFARDRIVNFTAVGPRSHRATIQTRWRTLDTRQMANVAYPTSLVQGPDVNFQIRAEDPNGEAYPLVRFESISTEWGRLYVDKAGTSPGVPGKSLPTIMYAVRVDQIPPEKFGSTLKLPFSACVFKPQTSGQKLCSNHEVLVKLSPTVYPAPTIDRREWPLGRIQYVRENQELRVRLPVRYTGPSSSLLKVTVLPEAAAGKVSWERGELVVESATAETLQFNVTATSPYGVSTTESFLVEVLPYWWKDVLVLGESQNAPEVKKAAELFGNPQVANPALQPLDARTLALRKTLVVTTSAIAMTDFLSDIEEAASRVQNVILMSPLAGSGKKKLAEELKSLGLTAEKRVLDLTNPTMALSEVSLVPASLSGLTKPSKPVTLAGTTTDESKSPLSISLSTFSRCSKLLNLENDDATKSVLIAASCRRANGGRLIVSGFEWADAKPVAQEAEILKLWMQKAVE